MSSEHQLEWENNGKKPPAEYACSEYYRRRWFDRSVFAFYSIFVYNTCNSFHVGIQVFCFRFSFRCRFCHFFLVSAHITFTCNALYSYLFCYSCILNMHLGPWFSISLWYSHCIRWFFCMKLFFIINFTLNTIIRICHVANSFISIDSFFFCCWLILHSLHDNRWYIDFGL